MGFSVGFRVGPVRVSNKGISAGVSAGPVSYSGFQRWGGRYRGSSEGNGGDTGLFLAIVVATLATLGYMVWEGMHWLHAHQPVWAGVVYGATAYGVLHGVVTEVHRWRSAKVAPADAPTPEPVRGTPEYHSELQRRAHNSNLDGRRSLYRNDPAYRANVDTIYARTRDAVQFASDSGESPRISREDWAS